MINPYEMEQAARDRILHAAKEALTPGGADLDALIARLDEAMHKLSECEKDSAGWNAYVDVCVAWAHARHLKRGTTPDLEALADYGDAVACMREIALTRRPQPLHAVEEAVPCQGCQERCGQCD